MEMIEVSDRTAAEVALLARAWKVTPGEAVSRLLEEFKGADTAAAPVGPIGAGEQHALAVHAVYRGVRVEGQFDTVVSTLEITNGPVPKRKFKTPSAAAIAVVSSVNPEVNANRNGWNFWTITDTGKRLSSIRGVEQ